MNTTNGSMKAMMHHCSPAVTLGYVYHNRHRSRDKMNAVIENALPSFSADEALAVVGAAMLARIEVPPTLDELAKSLLSSRRLTLRLVRALLALGKLEGEKLISA